MLVHACILNTWEAETGGGLLQASMAYCDRSYLKSF